MLDMIGAVSWPCLGATSRKPVSLPVSGSQGAISLFSIVSFVSALYHTILQPSCTVHRTPCTALFQHCISSMYILISVIVSVVVVAAAAAVVPTRVISQLASS